MARVPETDEWLYSTAPEISVWSEGEENPVVGVLYGPNDEVLSVLRQKPYPMGYARWAYEHDS